jgi:hypothetical protein
VVKSGDWLLGVQWSPETWPLVRDGQGRGVSMQGSAKRRVPSAEAVAALGKAQAYDRLASVTSDPGAARGYASMAKGLRDRTAGPAGHLATAAEYERQAERVTSPADAESYRRLAARERQKAAIR